MVSFHSYKGTTKIEHKNKGSLFSQNLESKCIIFYEEFEGAEYESTINFCVSCIVSKL